MMRSARLDDMVKGWFAGNFQPTAFKTTACEVAVKKYLKGDREALHHHRVATEVTVIVSGRVRMCGREWADGDIIVLEPGDATDFEALSNVVSVVLKCPAAPDDKYPGAWVNRPDS